MACCGQYRKKTAMLNKTDKYILNPHLAHIAKRQNVIAQIPGTAEMVNLAGRRVEEDIKETPQNPAFKRVIEAATQEHFKIIFDFDLSKNARNPRVILNPYYEKSVADKEEKHSVSRSKK